MNGLTSGLALIGSDNSLLSEKGAMRGFLISLAYAAFSPRHREVAEVVISKVCRDCDPAHLISEFITMVELPGGEGELK